MRILWFAVTPSMYVQTSNSHNGGGWISSLEEQLRTVSDVTLGIAFLHKDKLFKKEIDGVTYYPMALYNTKLEKFKHKYFFKREEEIEINHCLKIIDDFKPDLIHVFGSEWSFGLVTKYIKTPVVIHLQGFAHPYLNAYFPPGYSVVDFLSCNGFNLKKTFNQLLAYAYFKYRAERELRILKITKYFMGRTEWDRNVSSFFSLESKYFYCSEVLRNAFTNSVDFWKPSQNEKKIIVTTISPPLYKGIDLILKTALLLKESNAFDFEWHVFGVKDMNFSENKLKILSRDVNVKICGVISATQLKEELLKADVFIHPSYIDNSPNSICEAQILGLPVISTNVGGISSIIEHEKTGFLVPANDPYSMASNIKKITNDVELSVEISKEARNVANKRHNPKQILEDLMSTYKSILEL